MLKDLYNNAPPVQLLSPVSKDIGSGGTENLTAVDRRSCEGVEITVSVGTQTSDDAVADDNIGLALIESDDNSSFTAVDDEDFEIYSVSGTTRTSVTIETVSGDYNGKKLDHADDDNLDYVFRYFGQKRYVAIRLVEVGTGGAAIIGCNARLVNPKIQGRATTNPVGAL